MKIVGPDRRRRIAFVRACPPVDATTTRVRWQVAQDFAAHDVLASDALRRGHERTMVEDPPLLEAIQPSLDRDRDGEPRPVNAAADVATVRRTPARAAGVATRHSYLTHSAL